MDRFVRYIPLIVILTVTSLFDSSAAGKDYFKDSTLELPFRSYGKSVQSLLHAELRVSELLGISPIQGYRVSPESHPCKECIALDPALTHIKGQTIVFQKPNEKIELGSWLSEQSQIFIRDDSVAHWVQSERALIAKKLGETELFVVNGDQMTIAKIRVGQKDLELDEELVRVTKNVSIATDINLGRISQPYEPKSVARSVRESTDDHQIGFDGLVKLQKRSQDLVFKTIAIQLVNEFSEKYDRHTVSGVEVSLVGSAFKGLSDARGIVEIADIPAGSRFFARIHDRHGRIRDQLVEIATEQGSHDELFVVKTLRDRIFNIYERILDVPQLADFSSLCMRVMSDDGIFPLSGVEVRIKNGVGSKDIEVDGTRYPIEVGPIYFKDFVPVPYGKATFDNGRFCFLNLYPGLLELEFYTEGEFRSAASIPVGVSSHLEDDIYLTNGKELITKTVALPSVTDIVYLDDESRGKYHHVDYLDISTAEGDEFEYLAPGLLRLEPGYTFYRGRLYGLAQNGDFEDSLFFFDQITDSQNGMNSEVLTLLQRGFVEDLFNLLYLDDGTPGVAFNPELGKIFVRHGVEPGISPDSLHFRLVDQFGREVQQAWYFGTTDDGFIKLIFFNVEAGIYTLIVETENNHWIDVSTVPVDNGLTSIIQMGNQLELMP